MSPNRKSMTAWGGGTVGVCRKKSSAESILGVVLADGENTSPKAHTWGAGLIAGSGWGTCRGQRIRHGSHMMLPSFSLSLFLSLPAPSLFHSL